jgi:hypothetical protein
MIKRVRFVTRRDGLTAGAFAAAWVDAATLVTHGPAGVRPSRAVACTTLRDVAGTDARHDGLSIEWFSSMDALRRFETWLQTEDGQGAASASGLIEPTATSVFVAEELVLRGADWLARRWANDAVKLKHMALARRAEGLGAAEFGERWRGRSGIVGGAGSARAVAIPDAAKGLAYVQNHAVVGAAPRCRYDAVNEVYFDDLAALRRRVDFFSTIDVGRVDADLVSEVTFVAVAEHVL